MRARAISRLVSSAKGPCWGSEAAGEEEGRPGSGEAPHGLPLWPLSGQAGSALLPDVKDERCPEQLKSETLRSFPASTRCSRASGSRGPTCQGLGLRTCSLLSPSRAMAGGLGGAGGRKPQEAQKSCAVLYCLRRDPEFTRTRTHTQAHAHSPLHSRAAPPAPVDGEPHSVWQERLVGHLTT